MNWNSVQAGLCTGVRAVLAIAAVTTAVCSLRTTALQHSASQLHLPN